MEIGFGTWIGRIGVTPLFDLAPSQELGNKRGDNCRERRSRPVTALRRVHSPAVKAQISSCNIHITHQDPDPAAVS